MSAVPLLFTGSGTPLLLQLMVSSVLFGVARMAVAPEFQVYTLSLYLALAVRSVKAQTITAEQAKDHIGDLATVCGTVASAHYATRSRGQPTFLNLDEPYPRQVFTVVIWGSDRPKFGEPEQKYREKDVCVKGQIRAFRGAPEIVVSDPTQIHVRTKR